MQHCGLMRPFSVVVIRPVGLKAVSDGMCECLHSASGLAVLFRPPAGLAILDLLDRIIYKKTVGPVWPRPVSALSYLRKWPVIGGDVQGKIIIFS